MKAAEHYLSILLSLSAGHGKNDRISITIEDLKDTLHCTPRNVKLILRKLEDEGFIEWKAGVGRGNPSLMILLRDLEEVADEYFHDLLAKDKMKAAMDLLYHQNLPVHLRHKLRSLLETRFGFQVEKKRSATLDVLRVTMDRKPGALDPAFVSTSIEAFLLQQICNRLVIFDSTTKAYLPALAHTWDSNEDGSSWTFYLRKGVRFHHGRHLTTRDVLYTLQRLKEVNSPAHWQYDEIERVEIVSDHVISFYLRQPNRLFLQFFGSFYMSILPHDVEFSERGIIGTGPFRINEFTEQVLVLEAFGDYFRERAHLDRVELWFIPEDRQNDLYQLPHRETVEQNDQQIPKGEVEHLMAGCQFVVFNFRKKGIHHNPFFRRAIRLIFNRLAIVRELQGTRLVPADSFLPDKSKHRHLGETSLEEAHAQLLKSGYTGESLKLYYLDKKDFRDDAEWLQQRGHSIGLQLTLHPISISEYFSTDADQEADLLVICESLEDDIEWGFQRLFRDKTSFLHRFIAQEQQSWLDEKLLQFVQIPSLDKRSQIIDVIEQRIRDEDWILYGYHINKISRYHPALNGISLDSFGWIDFSRLWIKPYHTEYSQ